MQNIPEDIINQINAIDGCIGIVFTGSRQLGGATVESDWDFYVLLSEDKKSFRKTWSYNGVFIEVFCNTLESINNNELVTDKISNAALRILSSGEIILDYENILQDVKSRAKAIYDAGYPEVSDEDKMVMGYVLRTFIDDLVSLKPLDKHGYHLQDSVLIYAVECFYKLNKRWMAKPKYIEEDLLDVDSDFAKLYISVHELFGEERIKTIINLINLLSNKYAVPLTGEIMQYRKQL